MCSNDAPSGKIFQAAGGRFSMAAMYSNDGVNLGTDVTYESFVANAAAIMDMSQAQAGSAQRRRQKSRSTAGQADD